MDYKLAKRLKDAGFPQNTRYASVLAPWMRSGERTMQQMTREHNNDGYANLLSAGYDVVSIPTLSELIEACGEDFWCLFKSKVLKGKVWLASQYVLGDKIEVQGPTPKEAVAELYIALNPPTSNK